MKNWIDVATWREEQREKQEEENKLREGIQKFRDSGFPARNFFNVAARDARRKEEEERKMREGIQKFRDSGFQARDFFNVDKRDERRQKEKMMEEEKAK